MALAMRQAARMMAVRYLGAHGGMISMAGRVQNMHRMGLATATATAASDADTDDAKVEAAKKALREASTVCFDVDSTVCIDEGLDELAAYCGVGKEVEDLTNQAMGGSMPFEVALQQRLDILRPSIEDIQSFIQRHPPQLSDGVAGFIDSLHGMGKDVYLISGGFKPIIEPVADLLSIDRERIFAVDLLFNAAGKFVKFDERGLTTRSGGKPKVIELLRERHGGPIVMIGDGATDCEAKEGGATVIGFGGNQVREAVVERSDWFVHDFSVLKDTLTSE